MSNFTMNTLIIEIIIVLALIMVMV